MEVGINEMVENGRSFIYLSGTYYLYKALPEEIKMIL